MFPAYAGVILIQAYERSVIRGVPRVCGGDPELERARSVLTRVFPAYAGVILIGKPSLAERVQCSPRMRG